MSKEYNDRLKEVGEIIRKELPGTDFTLMVFSHEHAGYSNYVTNVPVEQMIAAMEELLQKLKAEKR